MIFPDPYPDPDPAKKLLSDRIRIRILLKVIVRPFEFGGATIGPFDPFNKLEAWQVFFKILKPHLMLLGSSREIVSLKPKKLAEPPVCYSG